MPKRRERVAPPALMKQYEVTGGGRLWYVVDDRNKTVWLTETMPGHPEATE